MRKPAPSRRSPQSLTSDPLPETLIAKGIAPSAKDVSDSNAHAQAERNAETLSKLKRRLEELEREEAKLEDPAYDHDSLSDDKAQLMKVGATTPASSKPRPIAHEPVGSEHLAGYQGP